MVQWISHKPQAYSNKTCVIIAAVQYTAQSGELNVSYVVQLKKADLRIFLSQAYLTDAGWEGAASWRSYLQLIQLAQLYMESCVWTCQGNDSPLDLCCIPGAQGHPTTSEGEKRK